MSGTVNKPSILPLALDGVWFKAAKRGKATPMPLIKDITLTLDAGPRTMIVGPNGAGKSLLLRLCHGLLKPSEGTVTWASPDAAERQDPRRQAPLRQAPLQQAMVFQRPVMLRRSAMANIDYALSLGKVAKADRASVIEEVLERTGLTRHAHTPARLLSGGEQQRLAIARAWALKPQVLFLDEPTASLDPSASHQIEELVNTIHAQGTKIVMTTHDLGQAKRLGDEVLFLHRGRLLERAPTEQFFAAPQNDLAQAFVKGELLWWRRGEGSDASQNTPRHAPKHPR